MAERADVRAWAPQLAGVREVFHARFTEHAYPSHTHAAWTLLIVDEGAVRYGLDHGEHGALGSLVTLLPPHVPHDGRPATSGGFRKRVIYLEPPVLDLSLIGAAVDQPAFRDPLLRNRIHRLHEVLELRGEALHGESLLALVAERLREHLRGRPATGPTCAGQEPADRFRELLDATAPHGLRLADAAARLHAHPAHLVRAFSSRFGIPPHRYLIGLRVDTARRLLLAGMPAARVATEAGFYDQAHLNRHFIRMLGTPPVRFARSA